MDKLKNERATAWKDHFVRFEGSVENFYLDGAGLVTIGIGCVVLDCITLPMVRFSDNIRASRPEIVSEYNAIKALPSGQGRTYYKKVCRLYLPESDILYLFYSRLTAFISSVEQSIVSLNGVPEPAALALIDMAFNLGIGGLTTKFPEFMNAFVAKDWKTCALECKRTERSAEHPNGVPKERNEWTRKIFDALAR